MKQKMINLLNDLYPLHRTLNHDDNLVALNLIKEYIGSENFIINEYEADSLAWTWDVPKRFHVNHAYLKDLKGNVIVDYNDNPLHIVSYSKSIKKKITFKELDKHLYYSDENINSIPWKYKYYDNKWGLCLTKKVYDSLDKESEYFIDISTEFLDKPLMLGELFIPGESKNEILIVTDICHPYQVNDSITGVVIAAKMAKELAKEKIYNSVRFLFVPETIGTIAWLASNENIIDNIKYSFCFDCLGNKNDLTLQKTMYEDSYLDFVAETEVKKYPSEIQIKKFTETMSNDELVTSAPGVEIPTIAFHRAPYQEYHTSADNPSIIDNFCLEESYTVIKKILDIMLQDYTPRQKEKGLIFMSKYDLHLDEDEDLETLLKIKRINQCINGRHTVYELSLMIGLEMDIVLDVLDVYFKNNLIAKE